MTKMENWPVTEKINLKGKDGAELKKYLTFGLQDYGNVDQKDPSGTIKFLEEYLSTVGKSKKLAKIRDLLGEAAKSESEPKKPEKEFSFSSSESEDEAQDDPLVLKARKLQEKLEELLIKRMLLQNCLSSTKFWLQ